MSAETLSPSASAVQLPVRAPSSADAKIHVISSGGAAGIAGIAVVTFHVPTSPESWACATPDVGTSATSTIANPATARTILYPIFVITSSPFQAIARGTANRRPCANASLEAAGRRRPGQQTVDVPSSIPGWFRRPPARRSTRSPIFPRKPHGTGTVPPPGGVAERLNAPVLKTGGRKPTWVRIPPPPLREVGRKPTWVRTERPQGASSASPAAAGGSQSHPLRQAGGPCQVFRLTVLSPPNAVRGGTRLIPRLSAGLLPS